MKDLVTVIIPFLNEEKYLGRSIESIINQTYKQLEILLIDDYSTDRSVEICKSFDDERIKIYSKKTEPRGLANSRNLGIGMAKGKYVVFHDADDTCLPERIEKQVALIKKHGENTIAGAWVEKIIGGEPVKMELPVEHEEIIKGFERVNNRVTIVAGIICFNKELHKDFQYNGNLKYFEDWDFLLRLYESGKFKFYNVPEYLYQYLIHSEGTKYRPDWMDWNLVVRANQERRKKGLPGFQNPSEMYTEIKKQPLTYLKVVILKNLINLKKRVSYEFRRVSKQ